MFYGLSYSAQGRYLGREVMFFGPGLQLPTEWVEAEVFDLSSQGSRYPFFGSLGAARDIQLSALANAQRVDL
jgi:hypothetical protein